MGVQNLLKVGLNSVLIHHHNKPSSSLSFSEILMKIFPSAAVLIIHDGEVLLVRHAEKAGHFTGTYGLPSGRIENGEREKEAAIRELFEEVGLESTEKDLVEFEGNYQVAEIDRKDGKRLKFGLRVFFCSNYSGKITNSDETIPEWVEINKLDNYNLLPNIQKVVYSGFNFARKN